MKDIIFVQGNIKFKSGNHQVKEIIAFASEDWKKVAEETYYKDQKISDNDVLMPYMIYCASEDIITYGNFISVLQTPKDVFKIYCKEIENLEKFKSLNINKELDTVLKRQIYIGVVGTMELFLCDFLYSMVLGYRKYYKRFCEKNSHEFKLKEISANKWNIPNGISKIIIDTNYHKIRIVQSIYRNVLDIVFPNTKKLDKLIKTRHNLVHRNGYPSKNSNYVEVSIEMIDELIYEVDILIKHIMNSKENDINNWIPTLTDKAE